MDTGIPPASIGIDPNGRRSVRAFEDSPVPRETVEALLRAAGRAPSNSNTQPWMVDVLVGDAKRRLTRAVMAEHGRDGSKPSTHFPAALPAQYRARQLAFGGLLYGAQGAAHGEAGAADRQLARNYDFYGAPVGMILSIDASLLKHSWLDCGIFLQTLMLEAAAQGLGTCAQVVFARHEAAIVRELRLPPGRSVICGISLGVPSREAGTDRLDTAREPLSSFCTFHGFDGAADASSG